MIWTGDAELFDSNISNSLQDITSYLSKIFGCLLNSLEGITDGTIIDILWNVMDNRLRTWEDESTKNKNYKKQYRLQLLLFWICSLESHACNAETPFSKLPNKLAKRAKVYKDYTKLSAAPK